MGAALVTMALLVVTSSVFVGDGLFLMNSKPQDEARGVSSTANIKTYFNSDLEKRPVNAKTLKIKELGTTTWLSAQRTVNNSKDLSNFCCESVATLNPDEPLLSGATYKVVVVGGPRGVRGIGDNPLGSSEVWTFTVDDGGAP